MTILKPDTESQLVPVLLCCAGMLMCALAEHWKFHDTTTLAIATNAAGLTLLKQRASQVSNQQGGVVNIKPEASAPAGSE